MDNPLAAARLESFGGDSEQTKRSSGIPGDAGAVANEISRLGLKKFTVEGIPYVRDDGETRTALNTARRKRLVVNGHHCAVLKVSKTQDLKYREGCTVMFLAETVTEVEFVIVWLTIPDYPENFFIIPTSVLRRRIPALLSPGAKVQVRLQPARTLSPSPHNRLIDIWSFQGAWMLLM